MSDYEQLKLKNQLCFPLYACSREIIKNYTPLLKKIGLTYTQYIAMLVLWEHEKISFKKLGELLFLDSGTLTPVIKSLEKKGLLTKIKDVNDERALLVAITEEGKNLKEKAVNIPLKMGCSLNLTEEEAKNLYILTYKLLNNSGKK